MRTFTVIQRGVVRCRQQLNELYSNALLNWCLSEEMPKEAWSQSVSYETVNQDLPLPCDSVSQEANCRWLLAGWSHRHDIRSRLAALNACMKLEQKQAGELLGRPCVITAASVSKASYHRSCCEDVKWGIAGTCGLCFVLHVWRAEEEKRKQCKNQDSQQRKS